MLRCRVLRLVGCQVIRVELEALGFDDTEFEPIDIDIPDSDWEHTSFKYFDTNQYYLPTCKRKAAEVMSLCAVCAMVMWCSRAV